MICAHNWISLLIGRGSVSWFSKLLSPTPSSSLALELGKVALPALGVSIWVSLVSLPGEGVFSRLDRLFRPIHIFSQVKKSFTARKQLTFVRFSSATMVVWRMTSLLMLFKWDRENLLMLFLKDFVVFVWLVIWIYFLHDNDKFTLIYPFPLA